MKRSGCWPWLGMCVLLGCGSNVNSTGAGVDPGEQKEPFDSVNLPSLFDVDREFEYRADLLPESGEVARIPWAGSYWPTYLDSINVRWAGANTLSAVEKYEKAFGKTGIGALVSSEYGLRKHGANPPRWFGICHAWAPSAILEPEPVSPVEVNGVQFLVNDLKALVTYSYNAGLQVRNIAGRCNAEGPALDALGRPVEPACRDVNAGSFHVAVTNLVGRKRQSLVEDKVQTDQVWNHPVRGYRILSSRALTRAQVGAALASLNLRAVAYRQVQMELSYLTESGLEEDGNLDESRYTLGSTYDYLLELNQLGQIIGGEWLGTSVQDHPDFLWLPVSKDDNTVASGIEWRLVKELLRRSVGQAPAPQPTPDASAVALRATHSAKCLDVKSGDTRDQVPVIQYTCTGNANQRWKLEIVGNGWYRVRSELSGKCLDVNGSSQEDNAALVQYQCTGNHNQLFTFQNLGSGSFQMMAAHSRKCLAVAVVNGAGDQDNAPLVQQTCGSAPNQLFQRVPLN